MRIPVVLSIQGKQNYQGQDPEIIELVTEGILEQRDESWLITYEESDLTGLAGVTTTFQLEKDKITLSRRGPLNSVMVFQQGVYHDSLYQLDFGALMLTVCASRVEYALDEKGGTVDLTYSIEIEQSAAGTIEYHLQIRAKEE